MGTALALLLAIMLIPGVVKFIGDAQVKVHDKHQASHHAQAPHR